MSTSYIPAKEADLSAWLQNFSTLITATPATYGLTSGDASLIATAVANWTTAYNLTTSPTTKTATTVSAKNTQKVIVLAIARPYAQMIANNAGVSSANKIAVGVNPKTNTPTPIPTPTTNPVLTCDLSGNMYLIIRYRDSSASPSVKAKPFGAKALQIYSQTSTTPVTDPTELPYIRNITKSPFQLPFDSSDVGKKAYMASRWVTATGEVSPWSPIIDFVVSGQ